MLRLSIACLVLALISALFGFGGIAASFMGIAQILFFIFLVVFAISLVLGLLTGRKPTH